MDRWSLFFGLVGLASLILAIPLSIAANVLTPKIQNWWATTSQKRTLRRIERLEENARRLKTLPLSDSLSKAVHFGIGSIVMFQFGILMCVLFVSINDNFLWLHNGFRLEDDLVSTSDVRKLAKSAVFGIGFTFVMFAILTDRFFYNVKRISKSYRGRLISEYMIESLKLRANLAVLPVDNSVQISETSTKPQSSQ